MDKIVEMEGIIRLFGGVHALEGVSVHLHAGEVVGIIGHNGAGKSTLMKILSGALRPDGGEIRVSGKPVEIGSPIESHRLGIEMIFQDLALLDNLTAIENFFLGRELTRRVLGIRLNDTARMRQTAQEAIGQINPNFRNFDTEVGRLSGGQRQSISIARAVHLDTRVLIMDEPTAALGPEETEMVRQLVLRLKDRGLGIFMIGHDLQDVISLSDRIVAMRGGKVVGEIAADDADEDALLGMIISGKCPPAARPGPGAVGIAARETA
jgi:D-xylose transport system ATP-binding protein